jgi:phage tail sheath gpL-like
MSIDQSAIARVLGIDVKFENFNLGQALYLPQRVTVIGQGNTAAVYDNEKTPVISSGQIGSKYGFGSPIHLAIKQMFPDNNDGIGGIPVTVIGMDDDGSGIVADGQLEVTGTTETVQSVGTVTLGGIVSKQFVSVVGETPTTLAVKIKAAIDAVLDMPVITGVLVAGVLPLTSKWKGESANDISIQIDFDADSALTIAATDFANGAINPDVDPALAKIGDVWETMILNLLNYDDTASLTKYATYGEGRWDQLVKKPCVVISGTGDDFTTRTAITDVRPNDRVNFLGVSVGSPELPFVIAARALAKDIAVLANNKPAHNYIGKLTGLAAGADDAQESDATRNLSVAAGSSTNILVGGVAELSDTITMYHPVDDPQSAYRYVVDIVKLMNVLFNVEVILQTFKGRPLAPDIVVTADPDAVQPKDVVAVLGDLAESLEQGQSLIIVDSEFTKQNITASISPTNPKRLDSTFPVKLSGNVEVNSNDTKFGFFFGSVA